MILGGDYMPKRLTSLFRSPPVILGTLLLLAGVCFGSTRDFEFFLYSIPTLGLLLIGTAAAAVWTALIGRDRRRAILALGLICLTPLAYFFSYGPVQQLRFLIWAPAHYRRLANASGKDGIVEGWDSWGWGGEDTFSYLVVDTQDRLGSKARADQWTKQIGQTCGMWQVQRVWPKLFIVTTYTECPYDGVKPGGW